MDIGPAGSTAGPLYRGLAGLEYVNTSSAIGTVVDGAYRPGTEWYVSSIARMPLGKPLLARSTLLSPYDIVVQ
jgi:hypothetical protein